MIPSPGTEGVNKSVYTTGLGQLPLPLLPPLLALCKSCWVPWKGATQIKSLHAKRKYSNYLWSIYKYTLHCLWKHLAYTFAYAEWRAQKKMLWSQVKKVFSWTKCRKIGGSNNMVLPTRTFGLVERSIVRCRPSQSCNEFSLGANISLGAYIDINQQRP